LREGFFARVFLENARFTIDCGVQIPLLRRIIGGIVIFNVMGGGEYQGRRRGYGMYALATPVSWRNESHRVCWHPVGEIDSFLRWRQYVLIVPATNITLNHAYTP
jgi:hypothetical protein